MKYLVDTSVFLWMIADKKESISRHALHILEENEGLVLSVVSTWEIAIKFALGKLELKSDPDQWLPDIILQTGFEPLPISQRHTLGVLHLPHYHKDPFDRLLISQAKLEEFAILSPDKIFKKYKVEVVW